MKPYMCIKQCIFYISAIFTFLSPGHLRAQQTPVPFLQKMHSPWVDSVFNTLTPEEKIAQLIVVGAYSNRGSEHRREILKTVKERKIGGLIFFQGGPGRQAALINEY